MAPIVHTQDSSSLTGPIVLGLQFIYIVGIRFPTLGSSRASFKEGLPSCRDVFPLPYTLVPVCLFSLFLSFLTSQLSNPLSLLAFSYL